MIVKEILKEFYAHWMYLHLKRSGEDYYSKDFLFKQYRQSETILSTNNTQIINHEWRKNICIYCNDTIISIQKSVGDHPIAELKTLGIHEYNLPCCTKCNSSKGDTDLLEWLERRGKSFFDIHGTAIMVYLRGLWRLHKEQKTLNKDGDIILEKYLEKLKNMTTVVIDTQSFTKYEKKQLETFAVLGTTKDDWETVEPDSIDTDIYGYKIPVYFNNPPGCKEIRPFLAESYDTLEHGRSDMKQCQLCGTKIDREWYFVCYEKNIFMKIGGTCFGNYSNIEKSELIKNTIWKMITRHLFITKTNIMRNYWNRWNNGRIRSKAMGYKFSMELKNITFETPKETTAEIVKKMIYLDMPIDENW